MKSAVTQRITTKQHTGEKSDWNKWKKKVIVNVAYVNDVQ